MAELDSRLKIDRDGDVITICFQDRNILEESVIQSIGEQINQEIERTAMPRLLLNFQHVEHLSSAALGTLITTNKKVKQKGGQLRLSNIAPNIYEVFIITKLNKLFKIYDDAQEAVKSFT